MAERDIREEIFKKAEASTVKAVLSCCSAGVLAGMDEFCRKAEEIGLKITFALKDGSEVRNGETIATLEGKPMEIALAEDTLVGLVAKPSGVATAASRAVKLARGRVEVVCGAWKKIPPQVKGLLRKAVLIGGAGVRVSSRPFIYLDKNYVRMFGGVKEALDAVSGIKDRIKVVQVRGDSEDLAGEARDAVEGKAGMIFVDTGRIEDVRVVSGAVRKLNARSRVKIAFGGNVKISDIPRLIKEDLDIVEIGREIIDAPLLDLKFDVLNVR